MATDNEIPPSSMPSPAVDLQLKPSKTPGALVGSNKKPVVVGLYGVPGSGKTYLLNQLKQEIEEMQFACYEGSEMIDKITPGGLEAFKKMDEHEKLSWRQRAIDTVRTECTTSGQVAVVTGHFMFWDDEGQESGTPVYTQNDLEVFSHILYLDVPAEVVTQRRLNHTERERPSVSATHLHKWEEAEKTQLRRLCREHGILFSLVSQQQPPALTKVLTLLRDFQHHTEEYNLSQAERRLDDVITADPGQQKKKILVMDADKTLTAQDTGMMFWDMISKKQQSLIDKRVTLKVLFSSSMGYTYTAFRQATLLYEEIANDKEFDLLCRDVAAEVKMHADFVSLLQCAAGTKDVGAIIVSCGLRRVWEKVLEEEGLSETVQVIGGGRLADGFVITGAVKAALVARLQDTYQMHVCAFGDGPLDIDMLSKADEAIVVVGEEQTRSKTMDAALTTAIIDNNSLRGARQALLPRTASPRLDTTKLPVVRLSEPEFVESLLGSEYLDGGPHWIFATETSATKLLATPMRNAAVAGPNLREAHRLVGRYLAIGYVADVVGLEPSPIGHVLGRPTSGYRLFREHQTTIVALMRGGEPMAFGVNDAFPLAMFVHAKEADDIGSNHLEGQVTVILVDSVINTGKTVVEFVERVRKLHATIRIVVVAGVVQAECVSPGSLIGELTHHGRLHVIALRTSDTKFKGTGATDTGNRLFNTTHMA